MELKRGQRPKTERNAKIMEYVEKRYTFESIAKIFHISKARVAQIVTNANNQVNREKHGE